MQLNNDGSTRMTAHRYERSLLGLWRRSGFVGAGAIIAVILLVLFELGLHSDTLIHRFRSVFAVGRAMDKVMFVEAHPPTWLVIGNSRMDNGVNPKVFVNAIGAETSAFNLGLPGANASALLGVIERLDRLGLLGPDRIAHVLIGLDESFLQKDDALGYEIFFTAPPLSEIGPVEYLRTRIHAWGYADNLKQLREPAKLLQFISAIREPQEATGGAAALRLGYRPGFGEAQDMAQVERQEIGALDPPTDRVVADFWTLLNLLSLRQVDVVIVMPSLLNRRVMYLEPDQPAAAPYRQIYAAILSKGLTVWALPEDIVLKPGNFINAGHLNDSGASQFSRALGEAMAFRASGSRVSISP